MAMILKRIIPCAANYDIWSYACSQCTTAVFNMVEARVADRSSVDERRSMPRHTVAAGATIELNSSDVPCMVRNVSAIGACLSLTAHPRIPKNFTLMAYGWPTRCRAVWRSQNQIGIAFR